MVNERCRILGTLESNQDKGNIPRFKMYLLRDRLCALQPCVNIVSCCGGITWEERFGPSTRGGVCDFFEITAYLPGDGGCEPLQYRPLNKDVRDDLARHVVKGLLARLMGGEFHSM